MARRTAIVACLFLAYSTSNALADCACLKIGLGICVPDPTCAAAVGHSIDKVGIDAGKAVEKAATDTGKALEKAGHPLPNTPASIDIINKATQDASHVINKSVQDVRDTAKPFRRLRILETGYSQLPELGREEAGYGLYSYAVLSSTDTNRSAAFLAEVFKSIPAIEQTGANPKQLNIFYVPIKKEKTNDFADAIESSGDDVKKLGATYATSLYDYKVGRTILDHICNPPDDSMKTFCAGDTSRGPYIFTYERPASDMEPVPPPFLFVDLSDIHPGAFGELVSAFRAQVKREDIADGVRINTPRLALLQIVLKGADLLPGVQKTVGDIVHSVGIGGKK
jgi:hypothetical protein